MPSLTRLALGYLMVTGAVVGVWALCLPHSFYDAFPGLGHTWVSVDGPFNGHLVRDVGGSYLVFAALAGLALVSPQRTTPFAVGFATLFFNGPHLVYHMTMLGMYARVDQVLNVVALGTALLSSIWLILPQAKVRP